MQEMQVSGTVLNVVFGIEEKPHGGQAAHIVQELVDVPARRRWYDLHEPEGRSIAYSIRVKIAFGLDDGIEGSC